MECLERETDTYFKMSKLNKLKVRITISQKIITQKRDGDGETLLILTVDLMEMAVFRLKGKNVRRCIYQLLI